MNATELDGGFAAGSGPACRSPTAQLSGGPGLVQPGAAPTTGLVEGETARRALERRRAEGEDAPVGRHEPVAPTPSAIMATTGRLSVRPPVEPRNGASP